MGDLTPTLNILMLLKVRDWLAAGAPEELNYGFGFGMQEYIVGREDPGSPKGWCGTSCCIAGFVALQDQPKDIELEMDDSLEAQAGWSYPRRITPTLDVWDTARLILGLTDVQAHQLFTPDLRLSEITPAEAARTIRHLIETGEVKWT